MLLVLQCLVFLFFLIGEKKYIMFALASKSYNKKKINMTVHQKYITCVQDVRDKRWIADRYSMCPHGLGCGPGCGPLKGDDKRST